METTSDASLPPELAAFWRTDDGRTACERALAYGIDLSLLDENLRLTPTERLAQNDAALRLVHALSEHQAPCRILKISSCAFIAAGARCLMLAVFSLEQHSPVGATVVGTRMLRIFHNRPMDLGSGFR